MKNWRINSGAIDIVKLPLYKRIDVVVIGGGPSGIASAETTGRLGLSTILIEKKGFCGGEAVAGLSATICGLYETNEEWSIKNGAKQIVFGFADKFKKALEKNGGLTKPQLYGNTYVNAHEPIIYKQTADKMLQKEKIEIMYHTTLIDVIMEEDTVKGVVVHTGSGMGIILAKRIIDCSGDAIAIAMAGGEFYFGQDGVVQNPSLIFKLNNIDDKRFWAYFGENTICNDEFSGKIKEAEKKYKINLPRKKIWVFKCVHNGQIYVNATSISKKDGSGLNCVNPKDKTYAEIAGREQAIVYAKFFREYIAGCENSYIGEHGSDIGVRQTRSIKGREILTNLDVERCRKRVDGIAKSSWPIELHKEERPKLHWLMNDYYEVPYGALVPDGLKNILVAGRSLFAEHEALASARVTAQCFAYGHAAGIATVMSMEQDKSPCCIKGEYVRKRLNEDGAEL